MAIRFKVLVGNAQTIASEVRDAQHVGRLRDVDIAPHDFS